MVDPVLTPLVIAGATWLGGVLTSPGALNTAGSFAVNMASSQVLDPVCRRIRGALGARMSGADGSLPRNHDVERAVRTAQMQAHRAVIADFATRATSRNVASDMVFARQAAAWVEKEYAAIGGLKIGDAVRDATVAAIDASLIDRSRVAGDRTLRAEAHAATEAALAEMEVATGAVPARLRARFLSHDPAEKPWFDVFGAFLAEQVKTNETFRAILVAARLAEIGASVRRIEEMADQWAAVADNLRTKADEGLERLMAIKEDTSATREALDDPVYGLKALHEQIKALTTSVAARVEVPPLEAEIDRLVLAGDLKTRAGAGFLAILSEQSIPPDQWATQLATFTERYRLLLAESEMRTNLPAQLEAERIRAEDALKAGSLERAESLFADLSVRMSEQRKQAGRNEAAILARRADIARTRLRYRDAAALLAEAAELEPAEDIEAVWRHRMGQADALHDQLMGFGDEAALRDCIAVLDDIAWPIAEARLARAEQVRTLHKRARAWESFGRRSRGPEGLLTAVSLYEAARRLGDPEEDAEAWAYSTNCLGNVWMLIGSRNEDLTAFKKARQAYDDILKGPPEARASLPKGVLRNNLGNVLRSVGDLVRDRDGLQAALATYRSALAEIDEGAARDVRAMIENNIGLSLWMIGDLDHDAPLLEEAIRVHTKILSGHDESRTPYVRARSEHNLALALLSLGEVLGDDGKVAEAESHFRAALRHRTAARSEVEWALTCLGLARALRYRSRRGAEDVREEALSLIADCTPTVRQSAPTMAKRQLEALEAEMTGA